MKQFLKAMTFVRISEGGTNYDPDDRGGLTNHGISQKQYPNLDIVNLKQSEAVEIYYRDYWLKNFCNELPRPLATVIFDSSVNCGVYSAGKWLQAMCNLKGSDLKIDGIIGNKTLSSTLNHDPVVLTAGVFAYRLQRYTGLLKRDPAQYKFVRGWMDRSANLIFYVL